MLFRSGIALMTKRRVTNGRSVDEHDLCRGPGNLTRALGIGIAENRLDLTGRTLSIEDRGVTIGVVARGPRIGIRVGLDRHWRCWIDGHLSVSGPRRRT